MITVRFPTGVAVTYNEANFASWSGDRVRLLTKEGGTLVASVGNGGGVIIEWRRPCQIENPFTGETAERALKCLIENVRNLRGYSSRLKLAALKRELANFDCRDHQWKD